VAETLPQDLLKPIIEEVLNYDDISAPKRYMENILRIFTPEKVQETIFKIMTKCEDFKTKCKAAGVLYCVGERFIIHKFSKIEEANLNPFGARYFWNGKGYKLEIVKEDIKPFIERKEKFYERRLEVLIKEFNKTDNIVYKYYLMLSLPNEIEEYPLSMQKQGIEIIEKITDDNFPKRVNSLVEVVNGNKDLEFLLYDELNWRRK